MEQNPSGNDRPATDFVALGSLGGRATLARYGPVLTAAPAAAGWRRHWLRLAALDRTLTPIEREDRAHQLLSEHMRSIASRPRTTRRRAAR